ncbi:retrovirus-related pol polyprotein from transposon TNT 1-94 [Tanacetum coccineum]
MVTTPAVPAQRILRKFLAKTSVETVLNMSPENKAHYEFYEKRSVSLILTGLDDEILLNYQLYFRSLGQFTFTMERQLCLTTPRFYKMIFKIKGKDDSQTITPETHLWSASKRQYPEQAQMDKDMRRIWLSLQSTSRTLQTYQTTQNFLKHQEQECGFYNPRYKTDNQTGQFGNQRVVNAVGARETVGGPVVQQSGIQCFNCKEFGHYAKDAESQKGLRTPSITRKNVAVVNKLRKVFNFKQSNRLVEGHGHVEIDEQGVGCTLQLRGKDSRGLMQIGTDT